MGPLFYEDSVMVICPYCSMFALLEMDSSVVYSKNYGPIWICIECQAWVGCKPKTIIPHGTLANAIVRDLRKKTHTLFDQIWMKDIESKSMSKSAARTQAYEWLASQMKIPIAECHMGMMQEFQLRQAIEILEKI